MNPNQCFLSAGRSLVIVLMMLMVATTAPAEWKEKVLYSFQGGSDGYTPAGGVVFDKAGNLYGANSWGGSGGYPSPGCGTVFELSPPSQKGGAWTETTIYAFRGVLGGVKDGFTPVGGVIIDQQGNLYGTTSLGGNGPCILLGSPTGCGTVYKLSPPAQKGGHWTATILHNFQGGNDGYFPWGDLIFDKLGNLYGATWFGGGKGTTCNLYYGGNCGTVFKLSPPKEKGGKWTEKILYGFKGVAAGAQFGDGANPNGGLVFDSKGAIYGTTYFGGNNQKGKCQGGSGGTGCGIVFKLTPPNRTGGKWTEKVLHEFNGQDGSNSAAGGVFDGNGNLYGTTSFGPRSFGLVFELTKPSGKVTSWTETVLHGFHDGNDGENPTAGLALDTNGDLYGPTEYGNTFSGTVFRLKPASQTGGAWTFGFLYGFTGSPDGAQPAASLIFDKTGNLYSTTQNGGTGACYPAGCGTVFEVSP